MGMTIDEHKEHLLDIMDSMPDDACGDWRDSLAYAIDTMRKYQKIQEIVKSWEDDSWTDGISEDCMEKISEVLKRWQQEPYYHLNFLSEIRDKIRNQRTIIKADKENEE